MTSTLTQRDAEIIPFSEEETSREPDKCAHIVKTKDGENAAAVVLEARIYGTPIEALCGHKWVPSKDPKNLPVCEPCKEIYELYKSHNDGLNDRPNE
jgi:hypothetical protein